MSAEAVSRPPALVRSPGVAHANRSCPCRDCVDEVGSPRIARAPGAQRKPGASETERILIP